MSEIFPAANGLPVPKSNLHRCFRDDINELGCPPGLDVHSLRRSYVTHLIEYFGFDRNFAQWQVGHEHASATSLYTAVSSDCLLREHIEWFYQQAQEATAPQAAH